MKKNNFNILIIFMATFVFNYASCFSASIYFVQNGGGIVDGLVSYDVMLDTEGETINAISGKLSYSNTKLDFYSFDTSNSFISNWLTEPKDEKKININNSSYIIFEGIVTGGFSGTVSPSFNGIKVGKLFTVNFKPKEEGKAEFAFEDIDLRLNDGNATKVSVKVNTASLFIPKISKKSLPKDIVFGSGKDVKSDSVYMSIDKDIFLENEKWFVYFSDNNPKHSINHYEIAESDKYNPYDVPSFMWYKANSPYILSQQSLNKFIHLKVLYNNGDFSYFSIPPVHNKETKDIKTVIMIILMALLSVIVLVREEKERSLKKTKR